MFNPTARLLVMIYWTLSVLALCTGAHADIYSWTDEAGNTVYSDQKPSEQAKPAKSSTRINYYTPQQPAADDEAPQRRQQAKRPATSNAGKDTDSQENEAGNNTLTEAQCQQQYRRSCDEVNNWQRYAREACGNDARCNDDDFLERKYRPRSNDEILAIARKAAIRNNRVDKKIAQFLTKKYSNYCENQAEMACQKKRGKQCQKQIMSYCEDPRSLNQIFQRYDNLSMVEKREIIEKAKTMALAKGDNELNVEQILSSLIEILVTQAVLGI